MLITMMYTGIYWHVIIYLFKLWYTCLYLVYTIISLVYVYIAIYLVYPALYLVFILIYQVYDWSFSMPCHMEGLFPMPCHMADSRQDRLYVNFYIPVTDIFISIHFLFILSSWLCNSVWEPIGLVIQVGRIPGACVKYRDKQSITCHMTSCHMTRYRGTGVCPTIL